MYLKKDKRGQIHIDLPNVNKDYLKTLKNFVLPFLCFWTYALWTPCLGNVQALFATLSLSGGICNQNNLTYDNLTEGIYTQDNFAQSDPTQGNLTRRILSRVTLPRVIFPMVLNYLVLILITKKFHLRFFEFTNFLEVLST